MISLEKYIKQTIFHDFLVLRSSETQKVSQYKRESSFNPHCNDESSQILSFLKFYLDLFQSDMEIHLTAIFTRYILPQCFSS